MARIFPTVDSTAASGCVTANDGSDFSGSSTTTMYPLGVRISHIQDGQGLFVGS